MLRKWIVLSGLRSLRIAWKDGAPGNEYRIKGNEVEFRAVDARGRPFGHTRGKWRALTSEEVQLHMSLKTPVADWLDKNLYPAVRAA
jgi:hypothetical protein